MLNGRFNKRNVALHLNQIIVALANKHHFTPNTGWAQVVGHTVETIVDYGQWKYARDLLQELELAGELTDDDPVYRGPLHNGNPRNVVD